MRHPSVFLLALALAAPAARAQTALVTQLSVLPGDSAWPRAVAAARARERAAPRFAALGLVASRSLLDRMDLLHAGAVAARGAAAARGATAAAPEAFAPERILLLEAPDPEAAERARVALAGDPSVDWVEPLRTRSAQLERLEPAAPWGAALLDSLPDDPLLRQGRQWGLWNIGPAGFYGGVARADVHAAEAWAVSTGANDLVLAVADTGIDPDQPELGGAMPDGSPRLLPGFDATDELVPAVIDSFGHGTPVTGVMAARTNDGPRISGSGVAGVCGGDGAQVAGCRILPIRITKGSSGEASSFDIARAIVYATDAGARAMNLSFAGPGSSRLERLALGYAIQRGCVVVVAAGNQGYSYPTTPQYPSAYAAEGVCIQVGATDSFDQRTVWSSYGPGLDLLAPGLNILTTYMTYPSAFGVAYDGYVAASGTSFAAPFVTGAVGLLAAARPDLADDDFQHVLRESADDLGAPGPDPQTGYGRLNLARALAAVRPGIGLWHDEASADSIVADGSGALAVGERGPGTLDRWSGTLAATRFAAYHTVTLPDSFADGARVWPRVGGTWAVRGDFRLPYFAPTAQVVSSTARTFTLRGWLYRIDEQPCTGCPEPWIPLPPEYVRFGFTVLGPLVARGPRVGGPPAAFGLRVSAAPNPFLDALEIRSAAPGRVLIFDAAGRRLRELALGAGATRWDGRDERGREAPPGLYFLRMQGAAAGPARRVVRLGR